jgi:hypothetical protein
MPLARSPDSGKIHIAEHEKARPPIRMAIVAD